MASTTGVTLASALRAVLPADRVSEDVSPYEIDGLVPSVVVSPADADEVAAAVAAVATAGGALVPWGTGGRIGYGNPPLRYDAALDMRRLNRIIEYEPADLTVTVEAGVLLSDLQAALGVHGQWLPLDPEDDGTIGGLIAANRSGPSRMQYGSVRDLCIGLNIITASGQAVKSGGRVVKNVAGYDMAKLHIGALGTLGVFVQATFKIAPQPAVVETVAYEGPVASLMSTALQIRNLGLAVHGLTIDATDQQAVLSARLAGGAAAVARTRREIDALAALVSLQASSMSAPKASRVKARVSVMPTAVPAMIEVLTGTGAAVTAYPTIGAMTAAWPETTANVVQKARALARSHRGDLVLETAPTELKLAAGVWGETRGDFAVMQRLKQQFDPAGTLSPGRFVGGL